MQASVAKKMEINAAEFGRLSIVKAAQNIYNYDCDYIRQS